MCLLIDAFACRMSRKQTWHEINCCQISFTPPSSQWKFIFSVPLTVYLFFAIEFQDLSAARSKFDRGNSIYTNVIKFRFVGHWDRKMSCFGVRERLSPSNRKRVCVHENVFSHWPKSDRTKAINVRVKLDIYNESRKRDETAKSIVLFCASSFEFSVSLNSSRRSFESDKLFFEWGISKTNLTVKLAAC